MARIVEGEHCKLIAVFMNDPLVRRLRLHVALQHVSQRSVINKALDIYLKEFDVTVRSKKRAAA